MKINWGTGLVIGMVLFMGFILFFVIKMSTDKNFGHDLVTEEFYQKGMVYQDEIDAEKNLGSLSSTIKGQRVPEGWQLTFPEEIEASKIKGQVFLYRPSNKQLDSDFPLVLSGSNLLIPDNRLLGGRWNINVDWEYEGKKYLYKKEIVY